MKYCEDYAALLDLFVDGELNPEEMLNVQNHLEECAACRAYVDDALAMRAAFPDAEETVVPEGFAAGVMDKIRLTTVPAKKKRNTPWAKALLPIAACCAIVLLLQNGIPGGAKKDARADGAAMFDAACDMAAAESAPAESKIMDNETALTADAKQSAAREESFSPEAEMEAPDAEAQNTMMVEDTGNGSPQNTELQRAAVLTLTDEEAGTLLDGFAPVLETEAELHYELSAEELDALCSALKPKQFSYTSALQSQEPFLVIVTR